MKIRVVATTIFTGFSIVSCDQPQSTPTPQTASAIQSGSQTSPPQDWNDWARWVDAQQSAGDSQGHGPDIGSDEWAHALEHQLGISDGQGHGPDLKSAEWRSAVEFKLRNP